MLKKIGRFFYLNVCPLKSFSAYGSQPSSMPFQLITIFCLSTLKIEVVKGELRGQDDPLKNTKMTIYRDVTKTNTFIKFYDYLSLL